MKKENPATKIPDVKILSAKTNPPWVVIWGLMWPDNMSVNGYPGQRLRALPFYFVSTFQTVFLLKKVCYMVSYD
jgi:hypothetical protein